MKQSISNTLTTIYKTQNSDPENSGPLLFYAVFATLHSTFTV